MRLISGLAYFLLSGACAHGVGAFMPSEGRYLLQWENGAESPVEILGSGPRRVLVEGGAAESCRKVSFLEARSDGIFAADSGVLLLPSNLVVGYRWVISSKQMEGPCVVERRIIAVGTARVEVETVGVCDGKPVDEHVVSVWLVGQGLVNESYTTGGWRQMKRVGTQGVPEPKCWH